MLGTGETGAVDRGMHDRRTLAPNIATCGEVCPIVGYQPAMVDVARSWPPPCWKSPDRPILVSGSHSLVVCCGAPRSPCREPLFETWFASCTALAARNWRTIAQPAFASRLCYGGVVHVSSFLWKMKRPPWGSAPVAAFMFSDQMKTAQQIKPLGRQKSRYLRNSVNDSARAETSRL
jgi:hypothetical protein